MHGRKNKENCALKLVDEIILYSDARSKKHKKNIKLYFCCIHLTYEFIQSQIYKSRSNRAVNSLHYKIYTNKNVKGNNSCLFTE